MIELAENVYYISGRNKSRFPYCACLYLKGRDARVLIDAGMGRANLAPCLESGLDVLILSHCHIDHRLTRREIPDLPVWCHQDEAQYLLDKSCFFAATGFNRCGFDMDAFFAAMPGAFGLPLARTLIDGDKIDLGGLTLEVIHTPGHTPGHLAFLIPEADLLYAADIDLTPFGPFYGHDFADPDDFIASIRKLKSINARIVATGHAGPFHDNLDQRFDDFEAVIYKRDQALLAELDRPRRLEDFKGSRFIYASYPDPQELSLWSELIHVEKHLSRLARQGLIAPADGGWVRI
ncbi:MAG: MBL fold metallo-hydrolase [Thermodesulfobacteriota bacterium]